MKAISKKISCVSLITIVLLLVLTACGDTATPVASSTSNSTTTTTNSLTTANTTTTVSDTTNETATTTSVAISTNSITATPQPTEATTSSLNTNSTVTAANTSSSVVPTTASSSNGAGTGNCNFDSLTTPPIPTISGLSPIQINPTAEKTFLNSSNIQNLALKIFGSDNDAQTTFNLINQTLVQQGYKSILPTAAKDMFAWDSNVQLGDYRKTDPQDLLIGTFSTPRDPNALNQTLNMQFSNTDAQNLFEQLKGKQATVFIIAGNYLIDSTIDNNYAFIGEDDAVEQALHNSLHDAPPNYRFDRLIFFNPPSDPKNSAAGGYLATLHYLNSQNTNNGNVSCKLVSQNPTVYVIKTRGSDNDTVSIYSSVPSDPDTLIKILKTKTLTTIDAQNLLNRLKGFPTLVCTFSGKNLLEYYNSY